MYVCVYEKYTIYYKKVKLLFVSVINFNFTNDKIMFPPLLLYDFVLFCIILYYIICFC